MEPVPVENTSRHKLHIGPPDKTVMTMEDTGNVGVGTTAPLSRLHVADVPDADGNYIHYTKAGFIVGGDSKQQLRVFIDRSNRVSTIEAVHNGNTNNRDLALNVAGGKVGVGTNNPKNTLSIKANGANNQVGIAQQQANGGSAMELRTHNQNLSRQSTRILLRGNAANDIEFYNDDEEEMAWFNGDPNADFQFNVCGSIKAEKVRVEEGWCDFVFDSTYQPMSVSEKEAYYKNNKHLPHLPSGQTIEKEGLDVGGVMAGMTQNIEENRLDITTLHKKQKKQSTQLQGLQKENKQLKKENRQLKKRVNAMEQKVEKLISQTK
jgi:hypothetical protein